MKRGRHWAACNLGQIDLQRGDLPRARRWFGESLELCHAVDDRRLLAASLEGAAATLSAAVDGTSLVTPSAVARMLGTAGLLRAQLGQPAPPNEQVLVDQAEAAARAQLGNDAFEAARAEGAALPLDEAVAYALDQVKSS